MKKPKILSIFKDEAIGEIAIVEKYVKVLRQGFLRRLFPKFFKFKRKGKLKTIELVRISRNFYAANKDKKVRNSNNAHSLMFNRKLTFDSNGLSHVWFLVRGHKLYENTTSLRRYETTVFRQILDQKVVNLFCNII